MSSLRFSDTETELSKTPEYQAARALEVAAGELETLKRQALDFVETLNHRIRAIQGCARDQRRRAFDRSSPSSEAQHVG